MKKIFTLITVFFFNIVVSTVLSAPPPPVPEKMSYQAVIRNSSNGLVASHLVGMRISILQSTSTGTAVYVETQTPTTNVNGLATIEIGKGTIVSGVFSTIDWSAGPYFIKTETDPAGGTAYTITATSELISVPYALMAKNAKSATNLTLPFSNSGSYTTTPFSITNTGSTLYTIAGYSTSGFGIYGKTNDDNSSGVKGEGSGANFSTGVIGRTGEGTSTVLPGNTGVVGMADAHIGVAGTAISGTAGYFKSNTGIALNTIGKLKLTGIGEAAGSILSSDATGNANWVAPLWKQYSATKIYYDAGWVGIGTSTVTHPLTITNANNTCYIKLTDNQGTDGMRMGAYTGQMGFLNDNLNRNIFFRTRISATAYSESITIAGSTGYVGIGDATPDATLDVEGTVKFGPTGKIFSEVREVTGTTGATSYYTSVAYPTGYSMANTRVLSVEINAGGTAWVGLGYNSANTANIPISYNLASTTLYIMYPDLSSFHSKAFRVMLMRVQ